MAAEAGFSYPRHQVFGLFEGKSPVSAGELGDPKVELPGLSRVTDPKIGDFVGFKRTDFSDATGHSGIYAGDVSIMKNGVVLQAGPDDMGSGPRMIGAGHYTVNLHTFEYLSKQKYVNPVFREITSQ